MTEAVGISIRIDPGIKATMDVHEEVNWSAVIRQAIQEKIEELEFTPIDREKEAKALTLTSKFRAMKRVTKKTAVEIIREWREKRR